jgi:hypothetical protein
MPDLSQHRHGGVDIPTADEILIDLRCTTARGLEALAHFSDSLLERFGA